MRVHFLTDYRDRYGVKHLAGDEADLRDDIVAKIVHYRIGKVVSRPVTNIQRSEPADEKADPVKRGPGRPRKQPERE